jgi:hypothetical protein
VADMAKYKKVADASIYKKQPDDHSWIWVAVGIVVLLLIFS